MQSPDFVELADAHGIPAIRVTKNEEVDSAIEQALNHTEGPIVVEFVVEKEENVFPMIPAGQTVNEIIDNPEPAQSEQSAVHSKGSFIIHQKG